MLEGGSSSAASGTPPIWGPTSKAIFYNVGVPFWKVGVKISYPLSKLFSLSLLLSSLPFLRNPCAFQSKLVHKIFQRSTKDNWHAGAVTSARYQWIAKVLRRKPEHTKNVNHTSNNHKSTIGTQNANQVVRNRHRKENIDWKAKVQRGKPEHTKHNFRNQIHEVAHQSKPLRLAQETCDQAGPVLWPNLYPGRLAQEIWNQAGTVL